MTPFYDKDLRRSPRITKPQGGYRHEQLSVAPRRKSKVPAHASSASLRLQGVTDKTVEASTSTARNSPKIMSITKLQTLAIEMCNVPLRR